MLASVSAALDRCGRRLAASPRGVQYACIASGLVAEACAFAAFAASGFLPPLGPSLSAEETARHYREHRTGIEAGAALMLLVGMFYLAFSAAASGYMRRIPGVPYAVCAAQFAGGVVGSVVFTMAGIILGAANYRPDRPVEITQALNDLFWLAMTMPWPGFALQVVAFAYAVLIDGRPGAPFPKPLVAFNLVVAATFVPATGAHCVYSGPLAWNGAVTFWLGLAAFACQVAADAFFLMRALASETTADRPAAVDRAASSSSSGADQKMLVGKDGGCTGHA
ncbi:hypothetical protein CDD83_9170 [Cordyceps sp. RAO-2017]|nr:hypothetical protein CDD83_9170 [Cordyceps sp. RAO-2017]